MVLNDNHVQEVNGTFRLRLHSGGAAVGHARSYNSEWFKGNAVKIWFGALNVPGGRGSNSDHLVDDAMATIGLVCPAVAPGDGIWATRVFRADTVQEIPLSEALQVVGAKAVRVPALLEPGTISVNVASSSPSTRGGSELPSDTLTCGLTLNQHGELVPHGGLTEEKSNGPWRTPRQSGSERARTVVRPQHHLSLTSWRRAELSRSRAS